MHTMIKIALCCSMMFGLSFTSSVQAKATTNEKLIATSQEDLKRLNTLWLNYKDHLTLMNQALNQIRNEIDENQRNAKIAYYTRKLEETKNALNRLILTHSLANQLRQQMIEHATKYQHVYKLSAVSKPTANQLSMFERLNMQTSSLFQQMQSTASQL